MLSDERVESAEAAERAFLTLLTSAAGREIKNRRAETKYRIESR
jgi:hypothetical protein